MTKNEQTFLVKSVEGCEQLLQQELRELATGVRSRTVADGVFVVDCPLDKLPDRLLLCFAEQTLPDAQALQAESISRWAELIFGWLTRILDKSSQRWRLDLLPAGEKVGPRRIKLIEQAIDALLQRHRRSLKQTRITADRTLQPDDLLLQVCFTSLNEGYLSAYQWQNGNGRWGATVWPSVGGVVEIADDQQPPSRAFKKLLESLQRTPLRISPRTSCVDLGAAPGSWSYVAAKMGAKVVAVDRSPLRADLMHNPSIKFVQGDAFRYRPEQPPVDWLLCDIAAYPERTLELLSQWLTEGWCRHFCVTFKFTGQPSAALITRIKTRLVESCATPFFRKLTNNKNEICAWGALDN